MKQKETFFDYPRFKNIREIIDYSTEKYPNNIAFRLKEKKDKQVNYIDITYEKLRKEINEFGTGLYSLGLKNKRVAIISKNRYEWILSYLSILLGGMIAVPFDKDFTEIEIENSLKKSKAECIIYDQKYDEMIKNIENRGTTNLNAKICMDKIDNVSSVLDIKENGKKILESGNTEYLNAKIYEKEMSVIVFTSGTTSNSKAVMLSQYGIACNICDMKKVEPLRPEYVNIALLPYHHTFGSTGQLIFLGTGGTTVYCDGLRYLGQNLKEYKVSFFIGVPKLIEAIYGKLQEEIKRQHKETAVKIGKVISKFLLKFKIDIRRKLFKKIIDQLGGLKFVVNGAAALNKDVMKAFNEFGIHVIQGYGLTECSPVLSAENYKYQKYGSIGFPMLSVQIDIANKNEEGIGEIRAKGPNIMLGYLDNQEATDEVIRDGWFYTGDLGYIDKDGYIFISGRKKNMIVLQNGKKVFPEEMEDLVNSIDLVDECFVYGMPKEKDVMLSVKIKYDKDKVRELYPEGISDEELEKVIWNKVKEKNKLVPKYKYIKHMILTTEDFIKTSTNKIKRFEEIKKVLNN